MATKFKIYVIRPVRNFLLYHMIRFLFSASQLVNRKLLLAWHGAIAKVVYLFTSRTRKAIESNLQTAFGNHGNPELYKKIGKNLFVCLAKTFTDYAILKDKHTRKEFSRYFVFEGEENLRKAYDRGKGVLCLVTHTPGWEFSAIMPPVLGYETLGVSSRIKNPAINRLMVDMRESRGMKDIMRDHCFETLKSELSHGKCLIIMIDQDSMNIRGEFLKFFGHEAYTPIGCARLAHETGAAVVPMFTLRNNDTDTYTFRILPEIPFEKKETDLDTFRYNTQKYNDVIEQEIRQNPIQWVWMHNRWKTTPAALKAFLRSRHKV